jgi:glycosyltransferase involved in cell wall biosynthesis
MASGASVITTRESSLPEVGGDAVVYAGTDVSSIGEAITTVVADTDARARRSVAARDRAAGFTWAASAAAHREAYRRAAARR